MKKEEAIKILTEGNKWRRGAEIEMPNAKEFGLAIDYAIEFMNEFTIDWEQRRYEIARDIFANDAYNSTTIAGAVRFADELIEALKGEVE